MLEALVIVAVAAFSSFVMAEDPPTTAPMAAEVERGLRAPFQPLSPQTPRWTLTERMEHHQVPGVSVAVIEEGRIAWAQGYGVAEAGDRAPVTPRTLFQAASISKPVSAALALSLAEAGALPLDADFEPYLGGWRLLRAVDTQGEISLRDLLAHCAGIGVSGFPGYPRGEQVPTLTQVMDGHAPAKTRPITLERPPHTAANYSGGGYTLVQYGIEEATHTAFSHAARERILEPLGMTDSSFTQPQPNSDGVPVALGHDHEGTPLPGGWRIYPEQAAAGLWSTPTDLARFAVAVLEASAGEAGSVISPAMASAMLTEAMGGWGLGVNVTGEGPAFRLSHGGANEGYRAYLMAYPETGQGLVVMTNSDNGDALAMEILQSVADTYDWPDFGLSS